MARVGRMRSLLCNQGAFAGLAAMEAADKGLHAQVVGAVLLWSEFDASLGGRTFEQFRDFLITGLGGFLVPQTAYNHIEPCPGDNSPIGRLLFAERASFA